jgi:hypothetical protein
MVFTPIALRLVPATGRGRHRRARRSNYSGSSPTDALVAPHNCGALFAVRVPDQQQAWRQDLVSDVLLDQRH